MNGSPELETNDDLLEEQPLDAEMDVISTDEEKNLARLDGWVDKPDFRGDGGAEWRTAKEFLEFGRHAKPLVDNAKKVLEQRLAEERRAREELEVQVKSQATALKAIREAQEEDIAANAAAREAELNDELEAAIEAGDHKEQARIQRDLVEVAVAKREAERAKGSKPAGDTGGGEGQKIDPITQAWIDDNPWFVSDLRQAGQTGKDLRRTRMMNVIVAEMRIGGDKRVGREFFDAALAEVDKTLGKPSGASRQPNKVEGSRGGGTGDGGGGGKAGRYGDLPAEAKRQCDLDAKSLVGPTKKHKTLDAYRASWAKTFFEE